MADVEENLILALLYTVHLLYKQLHTVAVKLHPGGCDFTILYFNPFYKRNRQARKACDEIVDNTTFIIIRKDGFNVIF